MYNVATFIIHYNNYGILSAEPSRAHRFCFQSGPNFLPPHHQTSALNSEPRVQIQTINFIVPQIIPADSATFIAPKCTRRAPSQQVSVYLVTTVTVTWRNYRVWGGGTRKPICLENRKGRTLEHVMSGERGPAKNFEIQEQSFKG